jgi:luciferase family oxidoreductase group 1
MTFSVSVLDQSPIIGDATPALAIRETIALAVLADRLGYHRYWLAEHHSLAGLADASPEILLARLGAETQRIRLGTGGIMMPYYAPFKIAEQFRMLEALYPGRIDLGLGRAPGGHPRTARVLFDGRRADSEEGFIRQLAELSAIFKGSVPAGHPLHGQVANPVVETAPEMWVLGSSGGGAAFAAHLGMRFAFAHFINPYDGVAVARGYREHFQEGHEATPRMALAMLCVCTRDAAEAEAVEHAMMVRWLMTAYGKNERVPTVAEAANYTFSESDRAIVARDRPRATIGTPDRVARRIREEREAHGADEVILVAMAPAYELRSFTLEALAAELRVGQ